MKDLNQQAQDAYAAAHAETCQLASRLLEQLNDLPAPDQETHWGHVGNLQSTMAHLRRALRIEETE